MSIKQPMNIYRPTEAKQSIIFILWNIFSNGKYANAVESKQAICQKENNFKIKNLYKNLKCL